MSRIDLGISFDRRKLDFESMDYTVDLFFKTIFDKDETIYERAYLFDRETGKSFDTDTIKEALGKVYEKPICNRFDFETGGLVSYLSFDIRDDIINMSLRIRKDEVDISQMEDMGRNLLKFHGKKPYNYAFLDCNAEFDYEIDELEEMARQNESPYYTLILGRDKNPKMLKNEYVFLK